MKNLLYILIALTLFSCGTEPDVLTPIMGDSSAHFRGNSIGDSYQKVLKTVGPDNPTVVDEGVVSCELLVDGSELLVFYEFDEDELYSVQADIFFADSVTLGTFQRTLTERYNAAFGPVNMDAGFLVWRSRNATTEVEFTLADESIEFGQPKLSLTIYNFGY